MPFKFSLYGTPVAVSGRTFERGAAEQRVAPDVRRCDPERPLVNANVGFKGRVRVWSHKCGSWHRQMCTAAGQFTTGS